MQQNQIIRITGKDLAIGQIADFVAHPKAQIKIANSSLDKVRLAHEFLNKEITKQVAYGINTGFGPMATHILGPDQLIELQENLILSHAAGAGPAIDQEFVLASMLVRLNTLVQGYSGVSVELVKRLEQFINLRIIPIVPEHGAVGTSGDLVQLSHIALALLGKGTVIYKEKTYETADLLKKLKIPAYTLKPKEGLSLINGTAVMSGISAVLCRQADRLMDLALQNGALALELVNAFDDSFSSSLQNVRPHPGQVEVAARLRTYLKTSKLLKNRRAFYKNFKFNKDIVRVPEFVQEVYSLRCIPQILGPILDTLNTAKSRISVEINAVTDNPIIDLNSKTFLHGGNFHGDYVSATVDQLKMTIVKLSMLSERRLNFFLNPHLNRFLPPFLNLKKPGLTLGLQGMQFVATSTAAQNQTLAFPQYVHSIPTNGDNQDLVSMGTDAALIFNKVVQNTFIVLGLEAIALAQAVDFLKVQRRLAKPSLEYYRLIRKAMPVLTDDRPLSEDIAKLVRRLKNHEQTKTIYK
jgi:histidine ammonia-lyase